MDAAARCGSLCLAWTYFRRFYCNLLLRITSIICGFAVNLVHSLWLFFGFYKADTDVAPLDTMSCGSLLFQEC